MAITRRTSKGRLRAMRFFRGADRLESLRRRSVAKGELVDVTEEARKLGFQDTVCVSKRLWTGLVHPYPFGHGRAPPRKIASGNAARQNCRNLTHVRVCRAHC